MSRLLFIYDKLQTKNEQKLASLGLDFVAFGIVHAKMYWLNDTFKRRKFMIPNQGKSTKVVYGGIFKLKEYSVNQHKLHAYYNNSIAFTGETLDSDVFDFETVTVTPIVFSSLSDISKCKYIKGDNVECYCFIGNKRNSLIRHCMKKHKYYRSKNVDVDNFVQLIKERNGVDG